MTNELALARTLLDAAPDAVIIVNRHGAIVEWNRMAGTLFGYSASEVQGQPVEMLVPHAIRGTHPRMRDSYVNDGMPTREMGAHRELDAVRKDGSTFSAEISLSRVEWNGDACVIASVRNSTDRVELVRELRDSNATITSILNASSSAIIVIDDRRHVIRWNEAATRLLRVPGHAAINHMIDHVLDGDARTLLTVLESIDQQRRSTHVLLEWQLSRDRKMDVSVSAVRVSAEMTVIMLTDVSAQFRQRELEKSQARAFNAVLGPTIDLVVRFDREHRVTYVSRTLLRLTGQVVGSWMERTLGELPLPASTRDHWQRCFDFALLGIQQSCDVTIDEDSPLLQCRFVPELDSDDNVHGVIMMAREYTRDSFDIGETAPDSMDGERMPS